MYEDVQRRILDVDISFFLVAAVTRECGKERDRCRTEKEKGP
jgi:hypothetical protein